MNIKTYKEARAIKKAGIFLFFIIILSCQAFGANIITNTNANFPFPINHAYPYGIYSTSYNNTNLLNLYNTWKVHYISTSGANGYERVMRPDQSNDTTSEGIGYGMLMAVYFGDATTFNNLWSYMQFHLDSNNLMVWNLNSDGSNKASPADSETDGDEDIAFSVLMAAWQFGPSPGNSDASILTQAITEEGYVLAHDVDSGNSAVNPGDQWNTWYYPSYWDPAYYYIWANVDTTNSAKWNSVLASMIAWMAGATRNPANGLIGDSCLSGGAVENGDPCSSGGNGPCNGLDYLYNSCRVPWKFELYYSWNGVDTGSEQADISGFFSGVSATAIEDGYTVSSGNIIGTNHNACFTGPIGCSFMRNATGSYQSVLNNYCTETGSFAPNSFYTDSWQILSLLLMTGNLWDLRDTCMCATPTFTPTATHLVPVALLDSFEDGNAINNWGGMWYSYYGTTTCANDTTTVWPKQGATFVMSSPGWAGSPYGTAYCARVTGYVYITYCPASCNNAPNCPAAETDPYVGLGTNVDASTITTRDVSGFTGFIMAVKGDGIHQYSIRFIAPASVTSTGSNDYKYTFLPPTVWSQMQIPFSDLTQETGWGTSVSLTLVLQNLLQINWQTYDFGHGVDLSIDDVGFYPSLGWTPTPISTRTVTPTFTPPPCICTFTVTPTYTPAMSWTATPNITSTSTFTVTPTCTVTITLTPVFGTGTSTCTPFPTNTITMPMTQSPTMTLTTTPTIAINLTISSITILPASASSEEDITVVMQVINTGTNTANNVVPSSLSQSGGGAAVIVSGVSPASTPIAAGSGASFTWVYNIVICNNMTFSGTASGTDAVNGAVMTSASASSNLFTCATTTATSTNTPVDTATMAITQSATTTFTPELTQLETATITQTMATPPVTTATLTATVTITATPVSVGAPPANQSPCQTLTLFQNIIYPGLGKYLAIHYSLYTQMDVVIKVYNRNGILVKTIAEDRENGDWDISWDGTNDNGQTVSSGIYLLYMKLGKCERKEKVAVIR